MASPAEAWSFLAGDSSLSHDPFLLPDAERAVDRILHALLFDELIAVYGDYDADGLTATALLVQALESLGGRALPYIPHRLEEGYGLHRGALKSLADQGVQLLITVDCGSGAQDELAYARSLGLDVIVTDHHRCDSPLSAALANVNPRRSDSTYPFRELAGVGVAFKLVQALAASVGAGRELREENWLDLVAIGTVADVAPLRGENRYLVRRGLAALTATTRPGIQELMIRAGLRTATLSAGHISFVLAPRLNATGRLADSQSSYQLLTTTSREEARALAGVLEEHNAERQRLQEEALILGRERARAAGDDLLLTLWDEAFPPGVAGLVAGKLAEEFGRPTVVLAQGEEESRGSARSVENFDIASALAACQDLLTRFGGHAQAAGLTVPNGNLVELRRRLLAIASAELADRDRRPVITVDADLPLSDLEAAKPLVDQLAPFGAGNPRPTFLARGVMVKGGQGQIVKDKHLRLALADERGRRWEGMAFRLAELANQVAERIDVVYRLETNDWGGQETLRLNVIDLRPHPR